MASKIFASGYASGLKRRLAVPNESFLPGTFTGVWGVDKWISAKGDGTNEYGELVKITDSDESGLTIASLETTDDNSVKYGIVVRTQDGVPSRDDEIPYKPMAHIPLTVYPVGTYSTPAGDQNGSIVVVYTGSQDIGYDLDGVALYSNKAGSKLGTVTDTSTSNIQTPLVGAGKVFAPTNDPTAKCIKVRVVGGKR